MHGTLACVERPVSSEEVSEFLLEHGYEVYPQSLNAASHFVSMIDYPKHGYNSWQAYLKQVLHRLEIKINTEALKELARLYQQNNAYVLFRDAAPAVKKVKQLNFKTTIVTTIDHFAFQSAIAPVQKYFDTITTGYEAGCEKSNPKMHKQTLKKLAVIPEEAVMIGDALLVDIQIPKKLGMHTILLDRRNKITDKPTEADAKVTTLKEAGAIIEKWRKHKT